MVTTTATERPTRIEKHSIDVIPLSERHGTLRSMGAVWFVASVNLTGMATGIVVMSLGATLFWSLVAIVTSVLFGTIFMAFHSTQGPHLGLPQLVQSRPQFGYIGAAFTIFVFALINYIAYNTSDALLSSDAGKELFHIPLWTGYVIAAAIAAGVAIYGYDLIHRINRILGVPLIAILVLLSIGAMIHGKGVGSMLTPGQFKLAPFMTTVALVGGFQLGWAPYVSDYSRYLPPNVGTTKAAFWWTYGPSAISGIWVFCLGAVAQATTNAASPVEAFIKSGDAVFPGGGKLAVFGLLLGLLSVMAINQYGGSLTMLSIADSLTPLKATRRARVITVLLMAVIVWGISQIIGEARFNDFYGSALIYLAYIFTPWTAINLVDYFFVRRGQYAVSEMFKPRGMYGRWGWRGNVAYLVTILVMVPFMVNSPHFVGFIAHSLGDVDYSMFVGLVVGSALYWAFTRNLDLTRERELAENDAVLRTTRLDEDPVLAYDQVG